MQALGVARFAHPKRTIRALDISPGMIVADFGAGIGTHALIIAEMLEGSGRVYAVDVQRDLLRRAVNDARLQGHPIVEAVWGDIETPRGSKLADRLVDLVFISNLLFQLDAPERAFAEAWRVLKPTGRLALIEWEDSFDGIGPPQKRIVTKRAALDLAHRAAFRPLKEFDAGEFHYGIVFRPVARV